ncbi:MAG TPA: glycosyl transferase family 1 [Flavobacteriaceae bacterium]|nr:glycosyl transferase family 1 [Flavobacteriaceae bacterium]HAT64664.1 glycosyl transferase family 1 [Flavobacteriaceae bacterium]|tara:strand:+ start:61726 stop:62868 length:1143 start_codon:yes stop_codon:yes gene_type:complete
MKILLLGEYSRLHNSLKAGLLAHNCEVTLLGDGDGFKNFPSDISIQPVLFNNSFLKYLKLSVFKITGWDLTKLERGIRFWLQLHKLKNYDVVQLINETPVKTYPSWERFLLKKVFKQNTKIVLLSCGADFANINYAVNHKDELSLLTPYFKNPEIKSHFSFALTYLKRSHKKTHDFIYKNIDAVIASDYDYVAPLTGFQKYKGLIPNPIIINNTPRQINSLDGQIRILLGINRWNYYAKGIPFFEEALILLKEKYASKIEIIKSENLPYKNYVSILEKAHIILDQVYSKDQGYNALESMAMGKVVFTGAHSDFLIHFNLKEDEVCIDAKPDAPYLVEKLSYLIDNPEKIKEIGNNAQKFVKKEHHYMEVAKKYLALYNSI